MSSNNSRILRQSVPSDELICCLPGCGLGVEIYDPHQKLCFCCDHKEYTPKQVEDYCNNYYTDGEGLSGSSSDCSDDEEDISNDIKLFPAAITATINNTTNITTTTNNNIITTVNGATLTNYFGSSLPVKQHLKSNV